MKKLDCPLQSNSRVLPEHPAIICGDRTITYRELNDAVWSIADYLTEINIQPRDRVAIFAPSSVDYIKTLYALWRIGAIACPVSTHLPEKALNDQIREIECDFLITSSEHILTSPEVNIKKINLDQTIEQIRPVKDGRDNSTLTFNHDQDATIIFTSGSQGKPKGALHSYANHFYSAHGSNQHIMFAPQDRWYLSLPLYHVGGLAIIFRTLLGKGTLVITEPGKSMEETITGGGVTHMSLVATQLFRLLHDADSIAMLQKLKAILLGGSSIPRSIISRSISHQLSIYTTYGLTEMASQVATTDCITNEDRAQRARILPYRQVRISEGGEILVKGKTMFKGYVLGKNVHLPENDETGWFATGDLGTVVNNEYLRVSGRKDNMFISGGENIRPEEIERFLCQLEDIEQAIVVPRNNEEFGSRPVAFIKGRSDTALAREKLVKALQTSLPRFMTPDEFYFWPTNTEPQELKVNRSRLKKLIDEDNPDLRIIE